MEIIIDTVQGDFSLMLVTYICTCMLLIALFVRFDTRRNAQQFKLSHLRLSRLPVGDVIPQRLGAMQRCCRHHDVGCTCFLRDQTPR